MDLAPLATPQTARTSLSAGSKLRLETEISVTPLGLIAIGALVCGILLAVPPIVGADAAAARRRPPA